MNPTTYNLARMNMILHGVHYQRFDLKNEDTLESPAPEHADLRFEAIVANPPFSANWSASTIHENDDRFSAYGKLAPKTKADFAFVQHMVHHLDTGATMACVLPHGVLFRGAAEGHIRRYLIEDCNYLDAVIGLPANIFYGTGIPTCIRHRHAAIQPEGLSEISRWSSAANTTGPRRHTPPASRRDARLLSQHRHVWHPSGMRINNIHAFRWWRYADHRLISQTASR